MVRDGDPKIQMVTNIIRKRNEMKRLPPGNLGKRFDETSDFGKGIRIKLEEKNTSQKSSTNPDERIDALLETRGNLAPSSPN